jgi:membrane-bound lytic murein transglycosylase D
VLSEFDIDTSYAYDRDFENFVENHDSQFKQFYMLAHKRGAFLLPMVQRQLIEAGLSDLLAYLPMIESGFHTDIASPKKATGLWQFMPSTATEYNLTVGYSYDERCDPVNATEAAILHLQRLYYKFGKWYLAIIAYNCGEGRVSQAIRRAGTDDLSILIDEKAKYLPGETREYIKRFLLVAMIGESETIDFGSVNPSQQNGIVQVDVKGGTNLQDVALLLKMEPEELASLNSQYKKGRVTSGSGRYMIAIPYEKLIPFYLHYDPLPEGAAKATDRKEHFISHLVSKGETLGKIAEKYRTSIAEITAANHLRNDTNLQPERLLIIPVTEEKFDSLVHEQSQ